MATRRKQWFLATGIVLCAATGPGAVAGEPASAPPVMVTTGVITITQDAAPDNNTTPAPGAAKPAKTKPRNAPASAYNPVTRDAFPQPADPPPVPKKAVAESPTQTIHVFKPA